jgi:hypothetical protein
MALYFPAEGRNYLINTGVLGGVPVSQWYVVMYEADYEPQDDDTGANFGARAIEITAYAETTRPKFVGTPAVGGATSNSGAEAKFTMNAAKSVSGYAFLSSAGKGSTTGILLAIQRMSSPRGYYPGDVVTVPAGLLLENVA